VHESHVSGKPSTCCSFKQEAQLLQRHRATLYVIWNFVVCCTTVRPTGSRICDDCPVGEWPFQFQFISLSLVQLPKYWHRIVSGDVTQCCKCACFRRWRCRKTILQTTSKNSYMIQYRRCVFSGSLPVDAVSKLCYVLDCCCHRCCCYKNSLYLFENLPMLHRQILK